MADDRSAEIDVLLGSILAGVLAPLELDETLSTGDLHALVESVARLDRAPALAEQPYARAVGAALAVRRSREYLRRGLDAGRAAASTTNLDCAVAILGANGYAHVPALATAPQGFEMAHITDLERSIAAAEATTAKGALQLPSFTRASVLTLELEQIERDLRNKGKLFGLVSTKSDNARDILKPHLTPAAQDLKASEMAALVTRVRAVVRRRDEAEQALRPDSYARWLICGDGSINAKRMDAIKWVVRARRCGDLQGQDLRVLRDQDLVRALGQPELRARPRDLSTWRRRNAWPKGAQQIALLLADEHLSEQHATELAAVIRALAEPLERTERVLSRPLTKKSRIALEGLAAPYRRDSSGGFRSHLSRVQDGVREALLSELAAVHNVPGAGSPVQDLEDQVRDLVRTVVACLDPRPFPHGPIRVAIAGRTKAGKTTLRKVLTNDPEVAGIGRGEHRTTRTVDAFAWNEVQFLDTPGVAAKDDDSDAVTAMRACHEADAVVWVYSSALLAEELEHLQLLLDSGKPLLVVRNVKWRVDSPERLQLFARHPQLAFRHADGHTLRIQEIAQQVGVHPPGMLTVHAAAAHAVIQLRAASPSQPDWAAAAWRASLVSDLMASLEALLSTDTRSLRAVRTQDAVRAPLEAACEVAETRRALERAVDARAPQLDEQARDANHAAAAALQRSSSLIGEEIAKLRRQLPAFARQVKAVDVDRRWAELLGQVDLKNIDDTYRARLEEGASAYAAYASALRNARARLQQSSLSLPEAPKKWWRVIKAGLKAAAQKLPKRVLAVFRKPNQLHAAIQVGLLLVDIAPGLQKAISESRVNRRAWEADAVAALYGALEEVRANLVDALRAQHSGVLEQIECRRATGLNGLASYRRSLAAVGRTEQTAREGLCEVDLLLARRLVALARLDPACATAARRVPGKQFSLTVDQNKVDATRQALSRVMHELLREQLFVEPSDVALARPLHRPRVTRKAS